MKFAWARFGFLCAVIFAAQAVFCAEAGDGKSAAGVPDVRSWRGVNLLGMFRAPGVTTDVRAPGEFCEEEFRWLKEWGFNFVRLPMDYRHFVPTNDWSGRLESGYKKVDAALAWGRKYGLHVQLCLHRAPGFTISMSKDTDKRLQCDKEAQEAFWGLWRDFAKRYKGISNEELSFNLVNEPAGFTEEEYIHVFGEAIRAIREEDATRFVMLDGNNTASTPVEYFCKVPLTGQAFRGYTPHAISHYGAWYIKEQPEVEPTWPMAEEMAARPSWIYELPGVTLKRFGALRKAGYPVMIGEFGCYNKIRHETCLKWMEACLELWKQEGIGWAIWNLRGPFGFMDSGRADVAYEDFEGHKLDRKMLNLLQKYMKLDKEKRK